LDALRTFFGRYIYLSLFFLYLAGILLAPPLQLARFPPTLLLAGLVLLALAYVSVVRGNWPLPWLRVLALCWLIFAAGAVYAAFSERMLSSSLLEAFAGSDIELTGVVDSLPRFTEGGVSFFVNMHSIATPRVAVRERRTIGRAYVFVREGRGLPVSYGYGIRLRGAFQRARGARNRGEFSMRDYLRPFGVRYEVVAPSPLAVEFASPSSAWSRLLYRLKRSMVSRAEQLLRSPGREIFLGLLIGDSAIFFPRELKDTFRVAGLTHLLVVSGSQVSLLFVLVGLVFLRVESPLTRWGRCMNVTKYIAALGVIFTYAVLTGYEPSIRRAFVVIVLVLLAHYLYYEAEGLNLLGQAGLILLLMHPCEAHSVSFQLTFAATLGLILALKVLYPHVSQVPRAVRWVLGILLSTAGAQLMVFPLLLLYFNQVSLWGLLSNLVAIPIASLILLLGILFYFACGIPVANGAVAWIVQALVDALHAWAQFIGKLPGADYHFASCGGVAVACMLSLILLGFVSAGWGCTRAQRLVAALWAAMLIALLAASGYAYQRTLPQFRVFWVSSGAASALIDRGREATLLLVLPPSSERQQSLISRIYWVLVRGGARNVRCVAIMGGVPAEDLWSKAPFRPAIVLDLPRSTATVFGNALAVSASLGLHGTEEGVPGAIELMLKGGARTAVVYPLVNRLQERLPATVLPQPGIDEGRVLVIPGGSAREAIGCMRGFLERHPFDAVLFQGSGGIPEGLAYLSAKMRMHAQTEKSELTVFPDGRAIIAGTSDLSIARTLYAKYIGH